MNVHTRKFRCRETNARPLARTRWPSWIRTPAVWISILIPAGASLAGPPLVLDDPHTIGSGNVEAILAVSSLEQAGRISTQAPLIDLGLGLIHGLDLNLIGSPTHAADDTEALPIQGNIAGSLKWQFLQADHWNASLTPGIAVNLRSGGRKSVVLPLQIEYARGRFAWGLDGTYLFVMEDTDQWLAGSYASFRYRDGLFLLAEVWALGVREGKSTDLGISGGIDWRTPLGPRLLASAGTDIASFGIERIEWRVYLGLQWNFRLWDGLQHGPSPEQKGTIPAEP